MEGFYKKERKWIPCFQNKSKGGKPFIFTETDGQCNSREKYWVKSTCFKHRWDDDVVWRVEKGCACCTDQTCIWMPLNVDHDTRTTTYVKRLTRINIPDNIDGRVDYKRPKKHVAHVMKQKHRRDLKNLLQDQLDDLDY